MIQALMPELADRKLREQWEREGASNIHQRALNRALDILSVPNSAALDHAVDARVRAEFEGLVAGDSVLQEGWKRCDVGPTGPVRARRATRRRVRTRT